MPQRRSIEDWISGNKAASMSLAARQTAYGMFVFLFTHIPALLGMYSRVAFVACKQPREHFHLPPSKRYRRSGWRRCGGQGMRDGLHQRFDTLSVDRAYRASCRGQKP